MRRIKRLRENISKGLHYNIPKCCITWWVFIDIFRCSDSINILTRPRRKINQMIWSIQRFIESKRVLPKFGLGRLACPYCLFFGKPMEENKSYEHK